jgi:hypothetical protein
MFEVPGFWMNETSGVLRPAVEAYLAGDGMTAEHIAAMRAYLRQWMEKGAWMGPAIEGLRKGVDGLTSREAIDRWLEDALAEGIDPI